VGLFLSNDPKVMEKNKGIKQNSSIYFVQNPRQVFLIALLALVALIVFSLALYIGGVGSEDFWTKATDFLPAILPAAAVLFSALWASMFATQNMESNRQTAKLSESLKIVTDIELDKEYLLAKKVWSKYRSHENHDLEFKKIMAIFVLSESDFNSKKFRNSDCGSQSEGEERNEPKDFDLNDSYNVDTRFSSRTDAEFLMLYFNIFEVISLSISKDIIDEDFYKLWHGGTLLRVWDYSVAAIGALRVLLQNPRLYTNWEKLAHKWSPELRGYPAKNVTDYQDSLADLVLIARNYEKYLNKNMARDAGISAEISKE